MPCPLLFAPRYLTYSFGPGHPFSPVRQEMLLGLLDALDRPPALTAPPTATREEILEVHDEAYVRAVEAASTGLPPADAQRYGLATPDVPVFAGMDEAARALVGGTLHAARLVGAGAAPRALTLGGGLHHARRAEASGFCIYNDLSAAVTHLQSLGLRVAYIDVDVHHGDGVQWLHYADPDVLTISLHQYGGGFYPGTGDIDELGDAGGRGYKLNVPLQPRTPDDSFLEAFEHVVPHALSWFSPDVLVVQCGADAHFQDPLADLLLTTHGFERLFRRIMELADEHTAGRAVYTLGGGYDLDAAVRVWTLLVHLLQERPLPERLPGAWRSEWETRLERPLTPTLHDPPRRLDPPGLDALAEANRLTAKRLLNGAAKCWS